MVPATGQPVDPADTVAKYDSLGDRQSLRVFASALHNLLALRLIRLTAAANIEIAVRRKHAVVVPDRQLEFFTDVPIVLNLPTGAVLILQLQAKRPQLVPPRPGAACLGQGSVDPHRSSLVIEVEVGASRQTARNPGQRAWLAKRFGRVPGRMPGGVFLLSPRHHKGSAKRDASDILLAAERAGKVKRLLVGRYGLSREQLAGIGSAEPLERPHTIEG